MAEKLNTTSAVASPLVRGGGTLSTTARCSSLSGGCTGRTTAVSLAASAVTSAAGAAAPVTGWEAGENCGRRAYLTVQ
jgi:hypothetical protein